MKKILLLFYFSQFAFLALNSQSLNNNPGLPGQGNGAFLINALNNRLNLLNQGTFGNNGNDIYLSMGRNDINTIGSVAPNFSNCFGFTSTANSDRLFVGVMHDATSSQNHSLINWGDDVNDLLLFRHSTPGGGSTNNASMWANSRIRFGPNNGTLLSTIPTTTVEIEQGNGVLSGLRLRNLTNTIANRFLTVDGSGNVILADGASPNNWLLNGNGGIIAPTAAIGTQIRSGNYLGTQNSAALVLATNSFERMRITETGNVGIGTTNPANKLSVVSNRNNDGIYLNSPGNGGEITAQDNSRFNVTNGRMRNNATINMPQYGIAFPASINGAETWISGWDGVSIFSNSTERMRITSNGNVGIGTSNPNFNSTSGRALHIHSDGVNDVSALRITNGSSGSATNNGFVLAKWGQEYSKSVMFWNYDNTPIRFATNSQERMSITETGNVGIGTTNPSNNQGWGKVLDVSSNQGTSKIISTSGNGTNDLVRTGIYSHINVFNPVLGRSYFNQPGLNLNPFGMIATETNHPLVFATNHSDIRMTIQNNGNVGIGTTNPQNKLEITHGTTGNSGLRFTNLTSASNPTNNSGNGVLSVDQNGNVVYVKNKVYRKCNDTSDKNADLINDVDLPLNNNTFIFKDGDLKNSIRENRVGIGEFNNCSVNAKLHVKRDGKIRSIESNRIGILSEIGETFLSGEGNTFAYRGVNNTINPNVNYGVDLNVSNSTTSYGMFASTTGSTQAYGVYSDARVNGNSSNNSFSYGGLFMASGARTQNYGIYSSATSSSTLTLPNYGIFAEVLTPNANDWAGFFNGRTGSLSGLFIASDKRIKKDIRDIDNALEIISKINPKIYDFDNDKYPGLNLPIQKDNYGVLAQDLEQILPSLISESSIVVNKETLQNEKIKLVNYTELIPILIQAIKDQQNQIDDLKSGNKISSIAPSSNVDIDAMNKEMNQLKSENQMFKEKFELLEKSISLLCESGCAGLEKAKQNAEDADVLYQSIPNPTDSEALINFYLSKKYNNASIQINSLEGKSMETIVLDASQGKGSVKIQLGQYAAQTYFYSLIVDNKVVDTKKLTVIR